MKKKDEVTKNVGADNTGEPKKGMSNSVFIGLILLGISVLFMLILFGAFGTAGG